MSFVPFQNRGGNLDSPQNTGYKAAVEIVDFFGIIVTEEGQDGHVSQESPGDSFLGFNTDYFKKIFHQDNGSAHKYVVQR